MRQETVWVQKSKGQRILNKQSTVVMSRNDWETTVAYKGKILIIDHVTNRVKVL